MKKAVNKAKKAAGAVFLKKADYNGAEVGARIAQPFIRVGGGVGLHYLGKAQFMQGKYRWIMGPICALLGLAGELTINDTPTGKLLKGPALALTDFGIKDSLMSLAPGFAAKAGLSGIGRQDNSASEDSVQDWQRIARMIAEDQAAPATQPQQPGMAGTDTSNWVETVKDYEDVFDRYDQALR